MTRAHATPPHSHASPGARSGADARVRVERLPRLLLLLALGLTLLATVVGVVAVWPDDGRVEQIRSSNAYAADGVTFPGAEVVSLGPACAQGVAVDDDDPCGQLVVRIGSGPGAGSDVSVRIPPEVSASGLRPGDEVRMVRVPGAEGQPATFTYNTTERRVPLGWMLLVFVLLVVAIARLRGVMALVGLAFSGLVIWRFMLPALLSGESGTVVALTTASAIMFVVLYTTHGFSLRTSVALAGTLAGIAITGVLGLVVVGTARLTGLSGDAGGVLGAVAGDVDFQGLLQCGVIIAGLGVLNDVTITQASAVWELRDASPELSRRRAFTAGMRIGRDHIASTIYTIVFAYTGTALLLLLLLYVYNPPFVDLISSEELAEEVLRTLTSGIGLVLAVPLTTALAALIAAPRPTTGEPGPGASDDEGADPDEYAEEHPDFWGRWR